MSNDTTTAAHGNKSTKNARRYPPLPWGSDFEAWLEARDVYDVVAAFRAYVDADRAARTQSEAAEPVAYRLLRKNSAGEWVRDFNDWCDGAPSQALVNEVAAKPDLWRIELAFVEPSVDAPDAHEIAEDAARWHWIAEYIVGSQMDLDVDIFSSETVNELRKLVDAERARKGGQKQ